MDEIKSDNPFKYIIATRMRDKIFLQMLGDISGKRMLDVGCGMGYFVDLFERNGAKCTGVDIDDSCLDYCRSKMRGEYLKLDLTEIPYPFPNEYFDIVVCSEVLEHIENNGAVIDEIRRILKPNGIFIASVPCREGMFGSFFKNIGHGDAGENSFEYHHHSGFSGKQLMELISCRGFYPEKIEYTMVFFVEIFMGAIKKVVGAKQGRGINSQTDSLKMKNSVLWRAYKCIFPILLLEANAEQLFSKVLKGHMVITKCVKGDVYA